MMTITLTPELERELTARAARQGTTPELLALHDLHELYADPIRSNRYENKKFEGKTLADVLAGRIGTIRSSEHTVSRHHISRKMRKASAIIWKRNGGRGICK